MSRKLGGARNLKLNDLQQAKYFYNLNGYSYGYVPKYKLYIFL